MDPAHFLRKICGAAFATTPDHAARMIEVGFLTTLLVALPATPVSSLHSGEHCWSPFSDIGTYPDIGTWIPGFLQVDIIIRR